MNLTNIRRALVNSYTSAAFGLPTAYENKSFDQNIGTPWARVTTIPNQPSVSTLGGEGMDKHTGLFQIDLNYPLNEGDGRILAKCDDVRDYYVAGKRFCYGSQEVLIQSCGTSVGREVQGMFRMVMTVVWQAQTRRWK